MELVPGPTDQNPTSMVPSLKALELLGKRQAAVFVGIQRNSQGLKHRFGHKIGAAARAAGADFAALDLFNVGNTAFFQGNHLQQVGIHNRHGQDVVTFCP